MNPTLDVHADAPAPHADAPHGAAGAHAARRGEAAAPSWRRRRALAASLAAACTLPFVLPFTPARAHGDAAHGAARSFDPARVQPTAFGQEGDPRKVNRTIRIRMDDRMRFEPNRLSVRRDETIRFVVANHGAVLHEMVLGTAAELRAHAELMKKHPGMEHDEPSMAHVKPGASGEIVWQFTRAGEFQFACLLPGHFEAGMVGTLVVR